MRLEVAGHGTSEMYVAYIDESGCTGVLPHSASPIQPLLVVGAIFIDAGNLPAITRDFLDICTF